MLTFKNSSRSLTNLNQILEVEAPHKLEQARSEKDKIAEQIEKQKSTRSKLLEKLEKQKELKDKIKELNLLCSQQEGLVNELKSTLNRQGIKKTLQLREARLERQELLKKIREMSPPQKLYNRLHKTLTRDLEKKTSPSFKKKSKVINWGEVIPKLQEEVHVLSMHISESKEFCQTLKQNELELEAEILELYDQIDEKDNSINLLKEQSEQIKQQVQSKNKKIHDLEVQKKGHFLQKQKSEEVINKLRKESLHLQKSQRVFDLKVCSLSNQDVNIKSSLNEKKKKACIKKTAKSKVIKHTKK